jgi:hypothetical protein
MTFNASRQKAGTIAAPNTHATMVVGKGANQDAPGRERAEKRDIEDGRRDQPRSPGGEMNWA